MQSPFREEDNPGIQVPQYVPVHIHGAVSHLKAQEGYEKTLLANPQFELRSYMLRPGEEVPREAHPYSFQVLQICRGAMDVILDDETHHVDRGDFFQIPPNAKHTLLNHGDEPVRYFATYTPATHDPADL